MLCQFLITRPWCQGLCIKSNYTSWHVESLHLYRKRYKQWDIGHALGIMTTNHLSCKTSEERPDHNYICSISQLCPEPRELIRFQRPREANGRVTYVIL